MANCHGFFLCSAWAEQRPSKPTTPQKAFDCPNGQVRSFRGPPSRPSFSTGPWSSCIVTVDDRHESENNACAYCMPVDLLPVLAVDLLVQQATACGLPEVFHVSPRSRSIARVDLRPWCEQYASDRSEVFRLQANDVTWPGVAYMRVYASQ